MSLRKISFQISPRKVALVTSLLLSCATISSAHALPATPAQIQACKVNVMKQTAAQNSANYNRNYNVNPRAYRVNAARIAGDFHRGLKVCEIDWGGIMGR
jgi:hypothetical protein